jgi:hypothetical protein
MVCVVLGWLSPLIESFDETLMMRRAAHRTPEPREYFMIRKLFAALFLVACIPFAAACDVDVDEGEDGNDNDDCATVCTKDRDDCISACDDDGDCIKVCDDDKSECVRGCT